MRPKLLYYFGVRFLPSLSTFSIQAIEWAYDGSYFEVNFHLSKTTFGGGSLTFDILVK